MKIFISYRRDESRHPVRDLSKALQETMRDDVFVDTDGKMPPGEDYRSFISQYIPRCDCLLVVIGEHWLDAKDEKGRRRLDDPGDSLRLEIEAGLANPSTRVIPVLIDLDEFPPAEALPESIRRLGNLNAEFLSYRNWDADVARLCQRLLALQEALAPRPRAATTGPVGPTLPSVAEPESTPRPNFPRLAVFAIAGVLAVVAIAVGLIVSSKPGSTESGRSTTSTIGSTSHSQGNTQANSSSQSSAGLTGQPSNGASGSPALTLSPDTGSGGSSVQAQATGFSSGETVQFYFQGELVGQQAASSSGQASVAFTVPSSFGHFPSGTSFTASAAGNTSADSAEAIFTLQ